MATIERRQLKRGISFRVEWRHAGERHRLTYSNEQEALEWKHLIEAVGGDPEQADRALMLRQPASPLLSEVAYEYIERLIDVTDFTIGAYKRHVRRHLHRINLPVDRLTEDDVVRWVAWMSKEAPNGKKQGYSPKTIQNAHAFLYSVLSYAAKRGHRSGNPAADTRLPAPTPTDERNKFITHEEFNLLLRYVPEKYVPHAVFLWGSGVRAGELLALNPEDFTIRDGTVFVSVTKAVKMNERGTGTTVGPPKTPRSRRTIDIDEVTMSYVWPLVRAAGHGNPVFPLSKPRTSSTLWRAMWVPAVKAAQGDGFTKTPGVHSLRHSHASHLLGAGLPMHEVSRRLGHAKLSITDGVYAHIVPSRQKSASNAMRGSIPAPSSESRSLESSPAS